MVDDRNDRSLEFRAIDPEPFGDLACFTAIKEDIARIGLSIVEAAMLSDSLCQRNPPRIEFVMSLSSRPPPPPAAPNATKVCGSL